MDWYKKKSFIMFLVLLIATINIIIIYLIMTNKKPSSFEHESEKGTTDCNPYEYITDYIPMQIPSYNMQGDQVVFHQLNKIDINTDKILDNMFGEYSTNLSEGIKDCFPEIDRDGNVSFSRISDDDYERYQTYQDYIGSKGTEMLKNLVYMTESRYNSLGCTTYEKNSSVEVVLLSMVLYSNVEVNILISKDFSKVQSIYDNSTYKELTKIFESEESSSIEGMSLANVYHYQQRIFKRNAESTTEEQIIYYTYFIKDDLEYIIQFKSNYTVLEGQKEYMYISDLHTQEECRNALISVLKVLITL